MRNSKGVELRVVEGGTQVKLDKAQSDAMKEKRSKVHPQNPIERIK